MKAENWPEGLSVCRLTPDDYDRVMKFILHDFILREPLSVAIDFNEEDAWSMTASMLVSLFS